MKQIDSAKFDVEVLHAETLVLVDFYTDLCPPCRTISPWTAYRAVTGARGKKELERWIDDSLRTGNDKRG
jgi:thioredoxin-like negative regulator of GroEL